MRPFTAAQILAAIGAGAIAALVTFAVVDRVVRPAQISTQGEHTNG